MSSEVTRRGKMKRPAWNYRASKEQSLVESCLEMLESIRNFLEGCQMMQCDVALSIKRQEDLLKKIERNTRKKRKARR